MKRRSSLRNKRPVDYFVAGQIAILVEHPDNGDSYGPAQLIEFILSQSYAAAPLAGARASPDRVLTFAHGGKDVYSAPRSSEKVGPQSSFLPHNRRGQAFDVRDLRSASQEQFSLVFFDLPIDDTNAANLAARIDRLNGGIRRDLMQFIRDNGKLPEAQAIVRAAAPNWLASPSQHWAGVGGPGARPTQAKDTDYRIELLNIGNIATSQNSRAVDVAILDTAPSKEQLRAAYERWVLGPKASHPLLKSLLDNNGTFDVGPGGRMQLVTAADLGVALPGPHEFRVRDHDYPMSDHGLFAAGVINSLAPDARLQLIEVLNEYGVGTLESIGRGLHKLLLERKQQLNPNPLVVNMSLTLAMPLEGHPQRDFGWTIFAEDAKLLSLSLEWICAALRCEDVVLVAAAGNDADEEDAWTAGTRLSLRGRGTRPRRLRAAKRPQARFPAAFPTVLGVGALLEDSDQPTEYSNLSDEPDGAGVWTFGGMAVDDEVSAESGMLGVYIGGFPTAKDPTDPEGEAYALEPSETGWGWWAGTSFAAPIISGTLAALAAQSGQLSTAEATFSSRLTAGALGGVFPARQGS